MLLLIIILLKSDKITYNINILFYAKHNNYVLRRKGNQFYKYLRYSIFAFDAHVNIQFNVRIDVHILSSQLTRIFFLFLFKCARKNENIYQKSNNLRNTRTIIFIVKILDFGHLCTKNRWENITNFVVYLWRNGLDI